ncbi:MAG: PEP-CTERM sorting domain-containing protein [Planctomycetes bacterium]|nr:PEP-CTERM sorting domain-containing protein [Planctomycetota bacterium]
MLRKLVILLVLAAFPASMVLANEEIIFFTDKDDFEQFNLDEGKFLKGVEDFEESTLDPNSIELLDDPLAPGVPNGPFPNGLEGVDNMIVQSNMLGMNAPEPNPRGVDGLVTLSAGMFAANSDVVGPNTFADSLDLIFDPDDNHTGVGFDVMEILTGNDVRIAIFDKANKLLAKIDWDAEFEKTFFGVWSKVTIGRINIAAFEDGGEIVDNVQLWIPEPASLSLLLVGGLAVIRRRR